MRNTKQDRKRLKLNSSRTIELINYFDICDGDVGEELEFRHILYTVTTFLEDLL